MPTEIDVFQRNSNSPRMGLSNYMILKKSNKILKRKLNNLVKWVKTKNSPYFTVA